MASVPHPGHHIAAQQPHGWDEAQDLDVTGGREDHVFQQAGGPCYRWVVPYPCAPCVQGPLTDAI